jgi:protein ImuB
MRTVAPRRPFVLTREAAGGPRVAALNAPAEALGFALGDPVADARAKAGEALQVRPADPAADRAALQRLALWATRYTPSVAPWGEECGADGFFLEVAGSAHLFGGEAGLLADLAGRLQHFRLPARLAVADTAGAAWALSHFHSSAAVVLPSGREAEALAPLPVAALRLSPDTLTALRRLGFKRVGAVMDKPRAPLAARFAAELLHRLDQALGRAPEPLACIVPPPAYHARRQLLEPIDSQEAIVEIARLLMQDLVPALERDGMGARTLRLSLYRIDGEVTALDIGFTVPTRSPTHVARLVGLELERLTEDIDAGFGFEALSLAATVAERLEPRQTELSSEDDGADRAEHCAALIDKLKQRLGPRSVRRLEPVESHLPERAERPCVATAQDVPWPAPDMTRLRPILLLPQAEPAEVISLLPEGPPRRFRWRGMSHYVTRVQGPERIAGEWWRKSEPTRDYYIAEDEAGRRFWLYREGIHGRESDAPPRWFVHGLFT